GQPHHEGGHELSPGREGDHLLEGGGGAADDDYRPHWVGGGGQTHGGGAAGAGDRVALDLVEEAVGVGPTDALAHHLHVGHDGCTGPQSVDPARSGLLVTHHGVGVL